MKSQMIEITQAALILHTTPLNILMHVKRGLLRGTEEDGRWMIEQSSLDEFLDRNDAFKSTDVCASGCAKKHSCGGGCG